MNNQTNSVDPYFKDRLLKPVEVAEILCISRSFAYQLMRTGRIPTIQMGKAYRVRSSDLQQFIQKNLHQQDMDG